MSDEKKYTEREKVLAERDAFERGWDIAVMTTHPGRLDDPAGERAKRLYPLPKVTRHRVVTDGDGDAWRWTPERGLEIRDGEAEAWRDARGAYLGALHDAGKIRLLVAELLANPTEEVDAE